MPLSGYVGLGWAKGLELVGQGLRQSMGMQGHERLGGGVHSLLIYVEKLNQEKGTRQKQGANG